MIDDKEPRPWPTPQALGAFRLNPARPETFMTKAVLAVATDILRPP